MKQGFSVALLLAGVVLIILGFRASESVGSEMTELVTGAPSDRTIWLLVGGGVAAVTGLFGVLWGGRSR